MTNEEKIQEMAFEAIPENISYSTVIERMVDYNGRDRSFFIDGARAAMKWKDQQFWSYENIEKIIITYGSFPDRSCPGELVKKTIEKLKP